MIKCEVSVCGTINKEAIIRTNKDGKSFMSFAMNIVLPTTSGSKVLDVSVLCDCEKNNDVSKFCVGTRLNASGTLLFKKRGENLYLNLYAEGFEFENVAAIDSIKGSMLFRGKLGKTIEEKTDKKGNKYRTFSGVSSERCQMALSISGSVSLISVKFLMTLSNQKQRWRLQELWICLSSRRSLPSVQESRASAHMYLLPTHLIKNSYGSIS